VRAVAGRSPPHQPPNPFSRFAASVETTTTPSTARSYGVYNASRILLLKYEEVTRLGAWCARSVAP
jgi:hypothetical protein